MMLQLGDPPCSQPVQTRDKDFCKRTAAVFLFISFFFLISLDLLKCGILITESLNIRVQ